VCFPLHFSCFCFYDVAPKCYTNLNPGAAPSPLKQRWASSYLLLPLKQDRSPLLWRFRRLFFFFFFSRVRISSFSRMLSSCSAFNYRKEMRSRAVSCQPFFGFPLLFDPCKFFNEQFPVLPASFFLLRPGNELKPRMKAPSWTPRHHL